MALSEATKKLLVLFVLFTIYLTLGMLLFVAIEGDVDNDGDAENSVEHLKKRESLKQVTMAKYNMTSGEFEGLFQKIRTIPEEEHWNSNHWDYGHGFSFAVQVVTTIGYGDITPRTTGGKIMCLIYALFGIPIAVLFLQAIGEEMLKYQHKLLKRGEGDPCYLNEKCVGMSFLFLIVLIFIGAGIQMEEGNWSFMDGVYCYFITFTTIGFGDLIPEGSVVRIIQAFYIILGLVVMSNVLNGMVGCNQSIAALKRFCLCWREEAWLEKTDVVMTAVNYKQSGEGV